MIPLARSIRPVQNMANIAGRTTVKMAELVDRILIADSESD
jgi:hypothetical protein